MFRYETHLHTRPVSLCAQKSVRENIEFYKSAGYDGVFITNHFLDGNLNYDKSAPYEEKINFYFADYEEGVRIGREAGLKVFFGAELSYCGTDFLVYGLDKAWFLAHPEIMEMKKTDELPFMMHRDAFVVQAHPFREASYIDHIRLFPRSVQAVEVRNACRTEFENHMAEIYADAYELLKTAGSDNHLAGEQPLLCGMECETPLENEQDFIKRMKNGEMRIFEIKNQSR